MPIDYDVLTMDAIAGIYCSYVRCVQDLNDQIEDSEFITSEDGQTSECFEFKIPREVLLAEMKRMEAWFELYPCDVRRCETCDEPRGFILKATATA